MTNPAPFKLQHIADLTDSEINQLIVDVLRKNRRNGELRPMRRGTIARRVIGCTNDERLGYGRDYRLAPLYRRVSGLVQSSPNTERSTSGSCYDLYVYRSDEERAAHVVWEQDYNRREALQAELIASNPDLGLKEPELCGAGHVAVPVDVLARMIEMAASAA